MQGSTTGLAQSKMATIGNPSQVGCISRLMKPMHGILAAQIRIKCRAFSFKSSRLMESKCWAPCCAEEQLGTQAATIANGTLAGADTSYALVSMANRGACDRRYTSLMHKLSAFKQVESLRFWLFGCAGPCAALRFELHAHVQPSTTTVIKWSAYQN